MKFELEPFDAITRPVVEQLWQLYKHDLSAVVGSLPDAAGRFPSSRLPHYFEAGSDAGFVLRADGGAPIGFCCVQRLGDAGSLMGDFFVVRGARRRGVGTAAAHRLLAMRPGRWAVPFQTANRGAATFWRRIADEAVGTDWSEETLPVPGKPDLPPDVWLRFTLPG